MICFVLLQVIAVENFINSVDSQMRQREAKQKLAAIASRIEAYDPVEGASEEVEKVRQIRKNTILLFFTNYLHVLTCDDLMSPRS